MTAESSIHCILAILYSFIASNDESITITDDKGQVTSELHFIAEDDYTVYHVSSTIQGGEWRITPYLPRGIMFDSSAMTISGYPRNVSEAIEYTITVRSTVVVNASFSLDVITCPSGFYYHLNRTGTPFLSIYYKSSFLRNVTVWTARDLCLYEDSIDIISSCPFVITGGCDLYIYGENKLLLMRALMKEDEFIKNSLSYHSVAAPVITAPQYLLGLTDQYFHYSLPILDHYYPVVIEPSNSEVRWNDITQELTVRLPKGVYTFTMSASNEKGRTETVLEIYINQCPPQYAYLHAKYYYGLHDYLSIYDTNQNIVFNEELTGSRL